MIHHLKVSMAIINGVKRMLVNANPGSISLISARAALGSTTRMIMKIKKIIGVSISIFLIKIIIKQNFKIYNYIKKIYYSFWF